VSNQRRASERSAINDDRAAADNVDAIKATVTLVPPQLA
jgi:hypothetical protein